MTSHSSKSPLNFFEKSVNTPCIFLSNNPTESFLSVFLLFFISYFFHIQTLSLIWLYLFFGKGSHSSNFSSDLSSPSSQLLSFYTIDKYLTLVTLRKKCPNREFFSDPHFPVFGLSTDIYSVNPCIQSKYEKIRTRKNSAFGKFSRSVTEGEHCILSFFWLF